MALSVRSGGTYRTPHTIWVRSGGEWKRVARVSIRSGGVWKSDAPLAVNTPSIVVGTGSIEQPPTLTLTPAPTGAPSPSYRLDEYRYNSTGGARTFSSSQTGTWTSAGVTTTMATNPPPGTKLSYELTAVGADGTTVSSTTVARWQIGTPAVTRQQAILGWGALSGWTHANVYFTIFGPPPSPASPQGETFEVTRAIDGFGDATRYENNAAGAMDGQAVSGGIRLIGNGNLIGGGAYPGTLDLYWGTADSRRLDELRLVYISTVGYLGGSFFSSGFSQWEMPGIASARDTQWDDPAAWLLGPTSRYIETVFTGLNRERAAGQLVQVKNNRPAYWGNFAGTPYGRMSVSSIMVRVRDWVTLGYETVVVTPAVPGAAW